MLCSPDRTLHLLDAKSRPKPLTRIFLHRQQVFNELSALAVKLVPLLLRQALAVANERAGLIMSRHCLERELFGSAAVAAQPHCRKKCLIAVVSHGNLILRHLWSAAYPGIELRKRHGLLSGG